MKNDVGLQVNMPKTNSVNQSRGPKLISTQISIQVFKKPSIVGNAKTDGAVLKASQQPREFYLYLGNLDMNTESDFIQECINEKQIGIHLLSCKIVLQWLV